MFKTSDHQGHTSLAIWIIFVFFVVFVVWASVFSLQKTVRASGTVMSETRVQIIQAVDAGTIANIFVREGDLVEPGDLLIEFDQTRVAAQSNEIQARVDALIARVARLRAELKSTAPVFPESCWDRQILLNWNFLFIKDDYNVCLTKLRHKRPL
jgi:adhesin transport system membrane fusion protein